jgi:hypothetical protein
LLEAFTRFGTFCAAAMDNTEDLSEKEGVSSGVKSQKTIPLAASAAQLFVVAV